jgi:predicted negative regulator of RcsB-dependent stress response
MKAPRWLRGLNSLNLQRLHPASSRQGRRNESDDDPGAVRDLLFALEMTAPNVTTRPRGGADDSITDWLSANWRSLAIGAAVFAAGGGGWWLYQRSVILKEERAEKAYVAAQQSVEAGNLDLGKADLEKLVPRYAGTNAGTMGAMLLAQVHYQQGQFAQGIAVLDGLKGVPAPMSAGVNALAAAGLEDMGKPAEAGARYEAAAKASTGREREGYLADAARAYQLAGQTDKATALWKQLADASPDSRGGEANVRLGELTAKAQ